MTPEERRAIDAAHGALVAAINNPTAHTVASFIETEWSATPEDQREKFLGDFAAAAITECAGVLLRMQQLQMRDPSTGKIYQFSALETLHRFADDQRNRDE